MWLFSRAIPIGFFICIPIFYKIQEASKKADMGNKNKKADGHHWANIFTTFSDRNVVAAVLNEFRNKRTKNIKNYILQFF